MVHGSKVLKLVLDGSGSYLGMEKGCFVLRDRKGNIERYPLFEKEIGEVVLKSGNCVSTGALASLGFWDIDVMIMTQRGKPVAMLKSLEDDSHVKTRLCQYEAYQNGKGVKIAKQLVKSRLKGQNIVLEKYGLEMHSLTSISEVERLGYESLDSIRTKLIAIEAKNTRRYFNQIFSLFSEKFRPSRRETFLAYDGMNNTFNLAYEVLKWKVHRAIVKAKLEPYLGFLHSVQFGKPSLVCDFQELYRYLIEDFLIQYCQGLRVKDFAVKTERLSRNKKGKREYLNDSKTTDLMRKLNAYFESKVEIPRIKHGKIQSLETLICEEALLFAKYLRHERESWIPRLCLFD
ncbi:MAG: CRISPR-associated endonuclease Cas1 [Candidatus Bathyarchaeia archaeon]